MTQSSPSSRRVVAAFSLYAAGGIAAFAWKILRNGPDFETYAISQWLVGAVPNLLPAAVLPALIFIRPRSVRFKDYLDVVFAILLGLIAYEFAQLWMPSRTFDVSDIVASILGAALGCLLCWFVFFICLESRNTGL